MDLLQKLCCFFILAKIVLQMCPSEKYEKYLQVLVTWMLYAMILLPLLGKGRTDSLQNWQQFRKEYEKSFTERMTDIDRMLSLPEEEQLKEHLTDSVLQKIAITSNKPQTTRKKEYIKLLVIERTAQGRVETDAGMVYTVIILENNTACK